MHLHAPTRTATCPRGTTRLSRTEFDIAASVLAARGRTVLAGDLTPPQTWGMQTPRKRRRVFDVTVCRLRERLRLVGVPLDAIVTVRAVGLRWANMGDGK